MHRCRICRLCALMPSVGGVLPPLSPKQFHHGVLARRTFDGRRIDFKMLKLDCHWFTICTFRLLATASVILDAAAAGRLAFRGCHMSFDGDATPSINCSPRAQRSAARRNAGAPSPRAATLKRVGRPPILPGRAKHHNTTKILMTSAH